MSTEQATVLAILAAVFALLVWGRLRHDVVAFTGLMLAVLVGLVPPREAFAGFGHPATVTVALVLILGRAMMGAGATDWIARLVAPFTRRTDTHIAALSGVGAVMSFFMNNVGALGLLLPVAMETAARAKRNPSLVLMPLSFGAILGGLVTLIGTPPNIIVATYRADALGASFRMFDFTPVGGVVMLAGLAFVATVGWRLVPERRSGRDPAETFELEEYLTEARVPGTDAKAHGMTLRELREAGDHHDALIAGVIRHDERIPFTHKTTKLQTHDVILIEADPKALDAFMGDLGLRATGDHRRGQARARFLEAADSALAEAVADPASTVIGRTPGELHLQRRFGVVLLGVSREGRAKRGRLMDLQLQPGDVLLMHGDRQALGEAMSALGLLPLRQRGHAFGRRSSAPWMIAIFAVAIAAASLGLVQIPIALGAALAVIVLLGFLPLGELYEAVNWPVIVLLGALIPIGGALEDTGATALVTEGLVSLTGGLPPVVLLVLVMVITMTLSDILNNAATAVVMAPIAVDLAERLSANPDAFLMAVAIGASCAFLTPIGHQNNALIFGPGGYRFSDYWRMGLPLELLIVTVAVPMILIVWPL